MFGVDVYTGLFKADRLIFGDSLMTFVAMLITAVTYKRKLNNRANGTSRIVAGMIVVKRVIYSLLKIDFKNLFLKQ